MDLIKINEKISYIPASKNPLSADIGIVEDEGQSWLFDVGCGDCRFDLNKEYNVVISHFHKDHMANIDKIKINKLYVSKETYKHLPQVVIDKATIIIVDSLVEVGGLKIFPIPSSHARGSLALEIDNEYTFLADATYSAFKHNKMIYNSQLLKEEIEALKAINSKYFLISHYDGLIRSKTNVIAELLEIYSKRQRNSSEIVIEM